MTHSDKQPAMGANSEQYADISMSANFNTSDDDVRQIIDFEQIQALMNSFYALTNIGIGLIDLKGNILVATGWQDICTKFHRLHPMTLANCIESDIYLSQGLENGNYKTYRCKNNLSDIATPIMVGDTHIANLFLGQFFFDDEEPDIETFTRQAQTYGFDREEYLAALERIPSWSRETVRHVMEFYTRLARMIAELSYRNIRLAQALDERRRAENALLESEKLLESETRFRSLFEHMLDGVAYCRMLYDHNGCPEDFVFLDVNSAYSELTGFHDVVGKKISAVLPGIKESSPELLATYGRVAATGRPEKFEIYIKQLSMWRSMSVYSTKKWHFVAISENITGRKRIEEELKESHHKLRELAAHTSKSRELQQKAFARKVHDELGTSLTLLKFDLAWLKRNHPSGDQKVTERLISMGQLIHDCTGTIQRLTAELRPALLEEQGLAAAIEWQTVEFEKRSGISCMLAIDPAIPALGQDTSINVYRIFQEALANVMRHAGATSVEVSLTMVGGHLLLRISDNGSGIREEEISAHTSFGILGMEERARLCGGDISIRGIPGKGTTISLSIPV